MMIPTFFFVISSVVLVAAHRVTAFLPSLYSTQIQHHHHHHHHRRRRCFQAAAPSPLDDELHNLESARANFEFLMQTEGLVKDDLMVPLPHKPQEYTPRPLTESSRQRREFEIQLLQSLADSDDAIDEIMNLWMMERGVDAAETLSRMENTCSPGLKQEEEILRQLMDEYGIHWAEPVSRLASLLYYKGKSLESQQWCEIALAVKPWHFEVAHTMVLNSLRQDDMPAAVRWQRRVLPPLNAASNHERRKGTRIILFVNLCGLFLGLSLLFYYCFFF